MSDSMKLSTPGFDTQALAQSGGVKKAPSMKDVGKAAEEFEAVFLSQMPVPDVAGGASGRDLWRRRGGEYLARHDGRRIWQTDRQVRRPGSCRSCQGGNDPHAGTGTREQERREMTINSRADALIDAMRRLTDLFHLENDAIRKRNVPALNAIADKKPLLVRTYEDCVRSVKADTDTPASDGRVGEGEAETGIGRVQSTPPWNMPALCGRPPRSPSPPSTRWSMPSTRPAPMRACMQGAGGMVMPAAYTRKGTPSMAYNKSF